MNKSLLGILTNKHNEQGQRDIQEPLMQIAKEEHSIQFQLRVSMFSRYLFQNGIIKIHPPTH